jgi:NAD(P)-dependent dehydrogenase (short-subunit alcohol dehydrogenase family)
MNTLDSFRLTGQTAIVTGGTRGIGQAVAYALADAGANVVITGRDEKRATDVTAAIESRGVRGKSILADVRNAADCQRVLDQTLDLFGGVDVLVNNAGICEHRPALDVTLEGWNSVFDVNVHGLWQMSQTVGREMVRRQHGAIVNIGSISALIVNRPQWQPAYNASKAAVHQLTKSLAAEWAPFGVRVNAVAPGYVRTEMSPVDDPSLKSRWIDDAAQQRCAEPDEIGPSVVYLASQASSFVTGSVLVIDGGYTLF